MMNFLTCELFLPSRTANQYLARYWFAVRDGKNSSPVKKFIINRVPRGSNPRVGNGWIMVKQGGLPGPCEPGVLPGTVRTVLAKPGVECSPDLPRGLRRVSENAPFPKPHSPVIRSRCIGL